ncbi:RAQPRD family integrative conjugative element protein [Pseudomonas vanderleydeniana]|uniref:RAQPRD family integrative conjugative element protein n=1 Tax=Pseudomonas vanderleydeniana TaxID=2745495 RepID=A0A9E6PG69_9PSED|nr:RAQPRD family integrative conjugative element protein [Pseudomonas vanderleydeniana]QXI26257.1 RAQPRD family integrative conjugative element protein [Pseudomonas vanderleydeniana]
MPLTMRHLRLIALSASFSADLVQAQPTAQERAHLEGLLRQLEVVMRQVQTSAALPTDEQARYTFDYSRLSAELELVRQGIVDHLTPSRVQPRDLPELTGHYTQETEPSP